MASSSAPLPHLVLTPNQSQSPLRSLPSSSSHSQGESHTHTHTHPLSSPPASLPSAKIIKQHPTKPNPTPNASLFFVGTATTILEWEGVRLMTDPNFLHKGDHVHLGPGVTATRVTDPAVGLEDLPAVDVVLLSHLHEDHFDRVVEDSLRRSLPIITTPHAKAHLAHKPGDGEAFTAVYELDTFQSMMVDIESNFPSLQAESQPPNGTRVPAMKVTAMPGQHVPPGGILETLNDFIKAVPPTHGWMLELGYTSSSVPSTATSFQPGYRIYISGDTLLVDELKQIPIHYAGQAIDLMLVHLGGTTIPSPHLPLLMVTMDAEQGLGLIRLINPEVTIPIHYDDYDVFLSPLSEFTRLVQQAGLGDRVVVLERGEGFAFEVRGGR